MFVDIRLNQPQHDIGHALAGEDTGDFELVMQRFVDIEIQSDRSFRWHGHGFSGEFLVSIYPYK
jgi:hypothetical protein